MRIAIFPCIGLGDGLISCVLAYNLILSKHQVTVFHPLMVQLQSFFPELFFAKRPEDLSVLKDYEKCIFFYEKLPWMKKAIETVTEKRIVLNPIATPNRDYPFWEEGEFDGNLSFVENLMHYAEKKWGVEKPTRNNGLQIPLTLELRKYENRVVIHPTSSRAGKNWTKEKFLHLAEKLNAKGFDPVFVLTEEEKKGWPEVEAPVFSDLKQVAEYIAESGWMIGNDSGIGHLASCLGVPPLTICRTQMGANFWKPSWTEGKIIVPPKWIPNLKGMRWRDKKWQAFISVEKIFREFLDLCEASVLSH